MESGKFPCRQRHGGYRLFGPATLSPATAIPSVGTPGRSCARRRTGPRHPRPRTAHGAWSSDAAHSDLARPCYETPKRSWSITTAPGLTGDPVARSITRGGLYSDGPLSVRIPAAKGPSIQHSAPPCVSPSLSPPLLLDHGGGQDSDESDTDTQTAQQQRDRSSHHNGCPPWLTPRSTAMDTQRPPRSRISAPDSPHLTSQRHSDDRP